MAPSRRGSTFRWATSSPLPRHLDELGVGFIEGGWPGANPKDTEFFAGRPGVGSAQRDSGGLRCYPPSRGRRLPPTRSCGRCLTARPQVVTLVAKSHTGHVELALRTTLEENLEMIRDTVTFLRGEGRRVFLDAEHFFDGYRLDRAYALEASGPRPRPAPRSLPCATPTVGCCPHQVADVVRDVVDSTGARIGIHCHNDTGCAVANSMAAVDCGRHPRAGHGQRLRRAHRQRRPPHRGRQPAAQEGPAAARAAAAAVSPPGSPTPSPRSPTCRPTPASPTSARAPSLTRPACTPARSRSTPTSTSTWTPRRSATTCECSCPTWPAAPPSSSRRARLGVRPRPIRRGRCRRGRRVPNGQGARAAWLHLRRGRRVVRAAAAP
jgi:hypothetical protein